MRLKPLILVPMLLSGCVQPYLGGDDPVGDDDDDTAADDDDTAADDDDTAADDDDTAADDDDTVGINCPPDIEQALSELDAWPLLSSCGDGLFSVGNSVDDLGLLLYLQVGGLALSTGQTWTFYASGIEPNDAVPGQVGLREGVNITSANCAGMMPPDTLIERAWSPVEGEVQLRIDEISSEAVFGGTVSTIGLVVQADSDPTLRCVIPDRSWAGLGFGPWPA